MKKFFEKIFSPVIYLLLLPLRLLRNFIVYCIQDEMEAKRTIVYLEQREKLKQNLLKNMFK